MRFIFALLCLAVPCAAFFNSKPLSRVNAVSMVAVDSKEIVTIEAPEFYWQYRLERLASKKGTDLVFSQKNYPGVKGPKDLYDAYYLDLTLQGKLNGFDWIKEKEISDAEWLAIYKTITNWSKETVKQFKPSVASIPSNDFDLLKQFYPQLNYRDLETPFVADEVGENFPYANIKELLSAAAAGNLKLPGFSPSTSLESTEIKKELADLKVASLKRLDEIYADASAFATNPFPDDQAREHYRSLKAKLADFPQSADAWAVYRANLEKQVDEMALLASKKEEEHHHGHEEEGEGHDDHHEPKLSVAEEFQAKYGKNLDELQEKFNLFKQDPDNYLENFIIEKFGKSGLDVWKKSQEFSAKLAVLSDADRAALESEFKSFLDKA